MFRLTVQSGFAAAHFLREYKGKCENLHGHNWKVLAEIEGNKLDSAGLLVDFGVVKERLNKVMDLLDHKNINEQVPYFRTNNPSAENLSRFIYNEFKNELAGLACVLGSVTVFETDTSSCRYDGD